MNIFLLKMSLPALCAGNDHTSDKRAILRINVGGCLFQTTRDTVTRQG